MVSSFSRHALEFDIFRILDVLVGVVFRLDDYSPTRWEDAVMNVQLVGFEEEAAKNGQDSQALPIRKMHDAWCWCHPDSAATGPKPDPAPNLSRSMCHRTGGPRRITPASEVGNNLHHDREVLERKIPSSLMAEHSLLSSADLAV